MLREKYRRKGIGIEAFLGGPEGNRTKIRVLVVFWLLVP
jgi:hypothetical protein